MSKKTKETKKYEVYDVTGYKTIKLAEIITKGLTKDQLKERFSFRDGYKVIPKIHGLKKAVSKYQKYNDQVHSWSKLMYDESDGEIWCDTCSDKNTFYWYSSFSIHSIGRDVKELYGTVTMEHVREYIVKTFYIQFECNDPI